MILSSYFKNRKQMHFSKQPRRKNKPYLSLHFDVVYKHMGTQGPKELPEQTNTSTVATIDKSHK